MKQFFENLGKVAIANILGVIIIVGSFILFYLLMIKEIPAPNKDIVNTAVGFLMGGALSGVIGYFYGASKSNNNSQQ